MKTSAIAATRVSLAQYIRIHGNLSVDIMRLAPKNCRHSLRFKRRLLPVALTALRFDVFAISS